MADHTRFVALSKSMIEKQGRVVTIQTVARGPSDPDKPWEGLGTFRAERSISVSAVFIPAYGRELGSLVRDTSLLKKVEKVALVSPIEENLEEVVSRLVDKDGSIWKICWAEALKPWDQTIIYLFGLER